MDKSRGLTTKEVNVHKEKTVGSLDRGRKNIFVYRKEDLRPSDVNGVVKTVTPTSKVRSTLGVASVKKRSDYVYQNLRPG